MLDSFRPKKTLREYLDQYADEHKTVGNKVTHMIGIPMIVASLPTMVVAPPVGGTMFVAGWAFQFAGHYYFEKNKPAFFDDPYYLLVGPVWVGIEFAQILGIPVPEALTAKGEEAPESKTTVVGQAVA